jgi:hypothetical protein
MQYYANKSYSIHSTKYRENFNQVNKFMAPLFAATSALRAAEHVQIFPMTKHAWWQLTFGMKENN